MSTKKSTKAAKKSKKPAAKKPAAKKPAAKKPAAKKPAAKKPAAKKLAAKKPAAKKPAAPLTEGMKHAVAIAANEVLVENLEAIIDDADAFLDGDDLGATYQSWIGADTYDAATVDRVLAELSTWAPPDDGTPAWQRLGAAVYTSALDVARALVHLATGAGTLPPAVTPHAPSLQHVVDALRQAIAEGGYDDEKLGDLVA